MSTVDPLLRLAAAQGADELLLRAGEPPALRGRTGVRALSMPTMDEALVRAALHEVVGEDADRPEGEGRHRHPTLGTIRVRWHTGERLEARFSRGGETRNAPITREAREARPVPAPRAIETPQRFETPIESNASPESPEAREQLARIVAWARAQDASDIVLTDGRLVAARVHGAMCSGHETLAHGAVSAMIDSALDERRLARLSREGSADVALEIDSLEGVPLRYRANRFRTLAGESAVLRPVRDTPPTLQSLKLPDSLARFVELHDGLVLVTGPAGSGKSTTLVAMIEHLNRHHARHVVTLEDPIEYVFTPDRAVVHQREVGVHVASFAEGLRAALRESPDVILLGELRDAETISAALTAAETGHLVIATLHCGSTAGAIDRMIDAIPDHAQRQVRGQLADVLRAVLGQRLLPAIDGGRVPAVEVLPMTAAVAHHIREGKAFQIPQALQTGRELGMIPMARAVADLVRAGVVERTAALRSVPDPQQVIELLGKR